MGKKEQVLAHAVFVQGLCTVRTESFCASAHIRKSEERLLSFFYIGVIFYIVVLGIERS